MIWTVLERKARPTESSTRPQIPLARLVEEKRMEDGKEASKIAEETRLPDEKELARVAEEKRVLEEAQARLAERESTCSKDGPT